MTLPRRIIEVVSSRSLHSVTTTFFFFFFSLFFPEPHQHLESPILNIKEEEEENERLHCGASCRFYFRFSSRESRSNPPA
ncbi:hypothetical protein OUZ56_013836 [Daphnia magna]|uniref:Secreted protein n=1 Tax=Daphnia magna TaxID=35525 RepID=A0ABQ9Z734_9CRUS|nr:hypothetical protein OUZ56_013836 [Daphnia magna]